MLSSVRIFGELRDLPFFLYEKSLANVMDQHDVRFGTTSLRDLHQHDVNFGTTSTEQGSEEIDGGTSATPYDNR